MIDILSDLLDGLIEQGCDRGRIRGVLVGLPAEGIDLVQEASDTFHSVRIPGDLLGERPHEHLVEPEAVGSEFGHDIVRIDDVVPALAHLPPVIREDQSDVLELVEWLRGRYDSDIIEEGVPESRIDEVSGRMLGSSHIEIDRFPVAFLLLRYERLVIRRILVAIPVPAGSCPLGHRVRFALRAPSAQRAWHIHPLGNVRERSFFGPGGLVGLDIGEQEGKVALLERYGPAGRAVDHRDRLSPVSLPGEHPFLDPVLDLRESESVRFEPCLHLRDRIDGGEPGERPRIDERAVLRVGSL